MELVKLSRPANRVRNHPRDRRRAARSGFVGGNRRYDRRNPDVATGMGRAGVRGY
jgi:hypothetical protein